MICATNTIISHIGIVHESVEDGSLELRGNRISTAKNTESAPEISVLRVNISHASSLCRADLKIKCFHKQPSKRDLRATNQYWYKIQFPSTGSAESCKFDSHLKIDELTCIQMHEDNLGKIQDQLKV